MFVHNVRLGSKDSVEGTIVIGEITILFRRDRARSNDILIGIDCPDELEIRHFKTIETAPDAVTFEIPLPKPQGS